MCFGDCVSVVVAVVVVVMMMVMAVAMAVLVLVCGFRRHSGIFFKFFDALCVDFTRVRPGCLNASMWEKIDDCFKILLGSFW